jgi:hypothetical protein
MLSSLPFPIIFSAILPFPLQITIGAEASPTSYFSATAKCVGLVIIAVASPKLSIAAFSFLDLFDASACSFLIFCFN